MNVAKNRPLLDNIDDEDTVSTFHSIHLSSSASCSTLGSTIYDTYINSASYTASTLEVSTIGYWHTAEKEGDK